MSQTIKIHELPNIKNNQVTGQNFMVLENEEDTYKITINELKELFSYDDQINAFRMEIEQRLQVSESLIQGLADTINSSIGEQSQTISTMNKNLNTLVQRVVNIEKEISDTINHAIKDINTNIAEMKKDIQQNNSSINDISDLVNTNKNSIESINEKLKLADEKITQYQEDNNTMKQEIVNMSNRITQFIEDVSNSISIKDAEWNAQIESAYDRLKKQIDYWHHDTDDIDHGGGSTGGGSSSSGGGGSNTITVDKVAPPDSVLDIYTDEDPSDIYGSGTVWELLYKTNETYTDEDGKEYTETYSSWKRLDSEGETATSLSSLNKMYPLGTVYTTTSSEDPADTFGNGEWELIFGGPFTEKYIDDNNTTQLAQNIYKWERIDGTRKLVSESNLNLIVPIGTIYTTTLDESPASIFNMGEWELMFGGSITESYTNDTGTMAFIKTYYKWKRIR